jgi:hydrogenase expression/formation protein HypD
MLRGLFMSRKAMTMENIKNKLNFINSISHKVNIMEVCGTHTMSVGKHGIRDLLCENVNLISGPGCPVCVTPDIYIDYIYELSLKEDIIIATYGDMMRVPGSKPYYTLEKAKAYGANIKMVYSSMDAVRLAEVNPHKKIVFLGIGFETTAPATAVSLMEAERKKLDNFYILSMHKMVEPVMKVLLKDKELKIDGFLCPGHVAVILGEKGFKFLEKEKCCSTIAGFEAEEVIDGLVSLVHSIKNQDYTLKNVYKSVVKAEGNLTACRIIEELFETTDDEWRGIGVVEKSGLKLKSQYAKFDIEKLYPIENRLLGSSNSGCQCGEVLKGKIRPNQCKLFGKVCTPENPVGPCMVSGEGSCAAYYKYTI